MIDRRALLALAAGLPLLAAAGPEAPLQAAAGPAPPPQIILLGTGGGPTPKALRAAPAAAMLVGGKLYVIDAGNGVARQIALAGLPLGALTAVFITHHHSDHDADVGILPWLAWSGSLVTPVALVGPPPLRRMIRQFLSMQSVDIRTRIADEGRPELAPLLKVSEVTRDGMVFADEQVRVTAARVEHPPITASYAYRIDAPGRSVVFSGDTRPCAALVDLARGADVLVQEAMYMPALDALIATESNAPRLRAHLLASHTPAQEAGRMAKAAGVKTLVLTHFVPGGMPIADELWRAAAAEQFDGEIIVGRDLMTL
jgi:ribonuclease BN (tRNA processing enzyme)